MLNKNWNPSDMAITETAWKDATLPHDGYVSAVDAIKLMVAFEAQAQEWLDHVANALLYKESAKFKRDNSYNQAFVSSEASSDRQRDIQAKSSVPVRVADAVLIEAVAALKLAEGKYDSAVRSHHAMKSLLKEANQEKWM